MSESEVASVPAEPRKRSRHVRPAEARVHVPARTPPAGRSHGLPSPRRLLAAQVVAWHNGHPLARKITRRQLGGYGVVSLPFSPALPEGQEGPPPFPMFDDLSLIPGLSRSKVVALALAQGWKERPGAPEWPLRKVPVSKGWNESESEPIYLLTVALKRGSKKPPLRLLIGRSAAVDPRGVIGHRLSSRPKLALAGASMVLPAVLLAWALKAMWPASGPSLAPAEPLVAEAARGGAPPSNGPSGRVGAAPERAIQATTPPLAGATDAAPRGPVVAGADDILPVPRERGSSGKGPRVGTGVSADVGDLRAAATSADQFRLVGPAQRDPTALEKQANQLQSALDAMGQTGGRLRMDVVGTAEGDALSIGPLGDQAEAERIARRLAAHGINLKVTEQP
ncbi:hypothetical protein AACH06_03690 [Ideonella sp. DXS29W]|uniref:SPOR domain-containing protein n=1 Tax=Ideonella lacteola TaxID=2984193 RepID=A0ABU9BJI6_9BURK